MAQEDTIRLALAAGFEEPIEDWMGPAYIERLERFAALVAIHVWAQQTTAAQILEAVAAEREACARIAETSPDRYHAAAAIRARGNT
jgi:hypothetical protein